MKDFTKEQQWEMLGEFTRKKLIVGEPSPHLKIVGHLSQDIPIRDRIWRAGCYGAGYSIITAEVLWTEWPVSRVLADPEGLDAWLIENWKDIHTRTERRCVRTPVKFSRCLKSYAGWMDDRLPLTLIDMKDRPNNEAYDILWKSINTVDFFGRYISIRVLDFFHRFCEIAPRLYDIRSIGGWSPKKMLCHLYPEHEDVLLGPEKAGDQLANRLAMEALEYYQEKGIPTDLYTFAAMLCEYRVGYENARQYPGRTHDQEISYFHKKGKPWVERGFKFQMFDARKAIFPNECLGELNGWDGIRDELSTVMRDHNYVWSDVEFDYGKTVDLAKPVRREYAGSEAAS